MGQLFFLSTSGNGIDKSGFSQYFSLSFCLSLSFSLFLSLSFCLSLSFSLSFSLFFSLSVALCLSLSLTHTLKQPNAHPYTNTSLSMQSYVSKPYFKFPLLSGRTEMTRINRTSSQLDWPRPDFAFSG